MPTVINIIMMTICSNTTEMLIMLFRSLRRKLSGILRVPKPGRYSYRMLTVFGNVGFIGIPLVSAVLGTSALIFVSLNMDKKVVVRPALDSEEEIMVGTLKSAR